MRESQVFIAKKTIKTLGEILGVDICVKSRKKETVYMRYVCCHLIKNRFPRITLVELAGIFSYKNHSSVVHSLSMYEKLKRYPDFKEIEDKIVASMGSFPKVEKEYCNTITYPSYV